MIKSAVFINKCALEHPPLPPKPPSRTTSSPSSSGVSYRHKPQRNLSITIASPTELKHGNSETQLDKSSQIKSKNYRLFTSTKSVAYQKGKGHSNNNNNKASISPQKYPLPSPHKPPSAGSSSASHKSWRRHLSLDRGKLLPPFALHPKLDQSSSSSRSEVISSGTSSPVES